MVSLSPGGFDSSRVTDYPTSGKRQKYFFKLFLAFFNFFNFFVKKLKKVRSSTSQKPF